MGRIFVTSDTHFSHARIMDPSFCGKVRPFEGIRSMNDEIIRRWNARIGKDDTVYHLGDVFWSTPSAARQRIFTKLQGHKHLILGNHDDLRAMRQLDWCSVSLSTALAQDDISVMMTHHPPTGEERHRTRQEFGRVLWLHGHIHSMTPPSPPVMDVGVDANDLKPWNLKVLVNRARDYYDALENGKVKLKELSNGVSGGLRAVRPGPAIAG